LSRLDVMHNRGYKIMSTARILTSNQPRQSSAQVTNSQHLKAFLKIRKVGLANAKPLIGISVGKDYHQGEHLLAIFSALNNQLNIGHFQGQPISMLVGGTLQRHNFWTFTQTLSDMELTAKLKSLPTDTDATEEEYLDLLACSLAEKFLPNAKAMEDSFIKDCDRMLADNAEKLVKLRQNLKTMKWSDYITHVSAEPMNAVTSAFMSTYSSQCSAVSKLYSENKKFREAVESTVDDFLQDKAKLILIETETNRIKRLIPALGKVDFTKLVRLLSKNYLLEEIPFFLSLAQTQGFTHNVYPAKSAPKGLDTAFKLLNVKKLEWTPIAFEAIDPRILADRAEKLKLRQQIEDELKRQMELKKVNDQALKRARFLKELSEHNMLPPLSEHEDRKTMPTIEEKSFYPDLVEHKEEKTHEGKMAVQLVSMGMFSGRNKPRPLSAPPPQCKEVTFAEYKLVNLGQKRLPIFWEQIYYPLPPLQNTKTDATYQTAKQVNA
jgi:hypothetical protein